MSKGLVAFAEGVDRQLRSVLRAGLGRCVGEGWGPELGAAAELVFWAGAVAAGGSPGMRALGLRFGRAGRVRLLRGALCILAVWLFRRLRRNAASGNWRAVSDQSDVRLRLSRALEALETGARLLGWLNALAFLSWGRHPSLLHRAADLEVLARDDQPRQLSVLAYVKERQVLWTELMALLAAAAQAVDWGRALGPGLT